MNIKKKLDNYVGNIKTSLHKVPVSKKTLKYIFITIIVIIMIVFLVIIYNKYKYNQENPVFFKKQKDAKKSHKITRKDIKGPRNGYNFTLSFWMYIDKWKYKLGKGHKHVLTKGRLEFKPTIASPAIFIADKINDLYFYLSTEKGIQHFILNDVPIKKWTYISMVVQNQSINIYRNAKIHKTYTLNSKPKINHGDLYFNYWGGFSGALCRVTYSSKALSQKIIYKQFLIKPNSKNFIRNIIKKWQKPSTKKQEDEERCQVK